MGRKSLEKQRTQQLLDAFIACIPEHGIEGTSLDQIAARAGMTRSLIRHYVGNRDELIEKLIDTIIQNNLEEFDQVLASPSPTRIDRLLSALFDARENSQADRLMLDALIHAKERFPDIPGKVTRLFEYMIEKIAQELLLEFPDVPPSEAHQTAYALFCISFSQDSLIWLGMSSTLTSMGPEMAKRLIQNLGKPTAEAR